MNLPMHRSAFFHSKFLSWIVITSHGRHMFSWGKLRFRPRGGVNAYSFFLCSCRSLRRWRPLPLDLDVFLFQEHYLGLRDGVHCTLLESLNPEYPRRDWPDPLISGWTFLRKSGSRSQPDSCAVWFVGFWLSFPPSKMLRLFLVGPCVTWTFSEEIKFN